MVSSRSRIKAGPSSTANAVKTFHFKFLKKSLTRVRMQLLAAHTSKCSCATSFSIGGLPLGMKAGPSRPKGPPSSKLFISSF